MVVVTRRRPHWRSSAGSTSVPPSCPDRSTSRTCTSGCVTTTTSRSPALVSSATSPSPATSVPPERSSPRLDRDADGSASAAIPSETSRSPAPSGPLERSSLRLDRDADGSASAAIPSETSRSPAPSGPLERSSLRLDRDADGGVWGARDPLVVNQPAQVRQSVKVPPVCDGLADDPLNADLAQRRPHADRVVSVRQRPHRGIALDEDMIVARVVDQPIPPAVELADHLQPDLQRLSIEPDLGGLGQLRLQGLRLSAPLIELLTVDVHATSGLTGQIR